MAAFNAAESCHLLESHCFQQAFNSPLQLILVPQILPWIDIAQYKYDIYLLSYQYILLLQGITVNNTGDLDLFSNYKWKPYCKAKCLEYLPYKQDVPLLLTAEITK